MSISVVIRQHCIVTETLEGEYVSDEDATVTIDGVNGTGTETLTASTTPPATKQSCFDIALSAGAVTINLASLPGLNGEAGAVDGTGLKVQSITLKNKASNANAMTITEGASNGHPTLGSSFSVTLLPGQSIQLFNDGVDVGTDIAAGDRTIDVAGTGAQVLAVHVVMG